ncbi:MAG: tRNA threonylcarbamoyladenosine dehydratase [Clostridia bacterium]|nr:tRNA threonylcarbamoyladenosine dehydratase [Clostridia bacterium]
MDQYARTELLLGAEGMARLRGARVALFGVGGVGGHAAEALVRSGVGAIDLFDNDTVSLTNLNRQLIATRSTIGMYKVDAMKQRLADIDPDAQVGAHRMFYMPENAGEVDLSRYDYVIDAIDTVTAKIELVMRAQQAGVPIICAMGAGNKLDPGQLVITDLYKTNTCPLAKVMRTELRRRGVKKLTVAYSTEPAIRVSAADPADPQSAHRRSVPGSTAFVPAAMGLMIAGKIVRDIALGGENA